MISENTVDKLAELSKLEFNQEEKQKIIADLNKILAFVEKLNEVNTEGVEPLIYMNTDVNILRDDVAASDISHEEALKNAPKKDSDYFRVPKFLG